MLLWSLVLFGSYRWAQRVFLTMSLAFFTYPVAMVLGHPHWGSVGRHLVVPHVTADKDFILLAVALIGTTVSPYMQFYAAAGVVDRGARPEDYRLVRADAVLGAVFACVISLTIIVATASAIGGSGPLHSAAQAAQALRPVAGGRRTLFALGLLGASALAAAVVPLSASYAIGEALGVERSVSHGFRDAPLFLGLFTAQIALGAAVAMTPVDVIRLLIGTQVLQGLITPSSWSTC
ncbi:divalent metal cation transporter [Streptomyces sp. M19]